MKPLFFLLLAWLLLASCNKAVDDIINKKLSHTATADKTTATHYIIKKGQHYCEQNYYHPIETDELKFAVLFDSSAIYRSTDPVNQYDINKLYGFSDNGAQHHDFSARFGWRWSDGALRLFAYIYNNGVVSSKELGSIAIGQEVICSIKASGSEYIFTLNDQVITMPRQSTTPNAKGYLLYPYFGGDEVAPQDITIRIKNL